VRKADIDQHIRPIDTRGADNGFHGELYGFAQLALQSILIKRV
jgi:hypothetical protein